MVSEVLLVGMPSRFAIPCNNTSPNFVKLSFPSDIFSGCMVQVLPNRSKYWVLLRDQPTTNLTQGHEGKN